MPTMRCCSSTTNGGKIMDNLILDLFATPYHFLALILIPTIIAGILMEKNK
jgi:hypothetical protein